MSIKIIKSTINFLNFVVNHPLNSHRKLASINRWLRWHIGSRIVPGSVAIQFVNTTKLLIKPGMRGATENIYTGLCEFEEMSFLLHLLNETDTFVDVGANVGVYTVLAAGVRGASCISIEPIPTTFSHLIANIKLNGIDNLVTAKNIGLSNQKGILNFTTDLDCKNHVIDKIDAKEFNFIEVQVDMLDNIADKLKPTLIKIDVEGFEKYVIAGGKRTLTKDSLLAVIMELNGSSTKNENVEKILHQEMLNYGFFTYRYSPFTRTLVSLEGRENMESRNTIYLKNIQTVEKKLKNAPSFFVNGVNV